MNYRRLGRTDIRVSAICLGTMTWGEQNTPAEAFAQMDRALDQGVNFFDTAEMYPVAPRADTYGRTEEIIGDWLRARGTRDKVVIATKVVGPGSRFPYIRDGRPRLDRKNILAAIDASLKRLKTDYVDLYQLHWPDRGIAAFGTLGYRHDPDAEETPLEETLAALDEVVKAGKARAVGVSNETPWGVMRCLALAEAGHGPRIASIQNPYSFLNRSFEARLAEIALREECGLLAYAPLGAGTLTGKYLDGRRPPGARLTLWPDNRRYQGPRAEAAVRAYVRLAREVGFDPAQMAIAFVVSRPFTTAAIIGATTLAQLENNIAAAHMELSNDVLERIEAIHEQYTYPCP
ncbi:MAG: NADP(H)-dependent aldo-keto reductase [Alphaproteobacteria bacterium]|nr:MAG: NADP(H)-dependent aldo-keto reductase [Alphaproteobacteria bacterium]